MNETTELADQLQDIVRRMDALRPKSAMSSNASEFARHTTAVEAAARFLAEIA